MRPLKCALEGCVYNVVAEDRQHLLQKLQGYAFLLWFHHLLHKIPWRAVGESQSNSVSCTHPFISSWLEISYINHIRHTLRYGGWPHFGFFCLKKIITLSTIFGWWSYTGWKGSSLFSESSKSLNLSRFWALVIKSVKSQTLWYTRNNYNL